MPRFARIFLLFVLGTLSSRAAQSAAPGTISGVVEPPVARASDAAPARIELRRATDDAVVAATTPDASGTFVLRDVPAGSYRIAFQTRDGTEHRSARIDVTAAAPAHDVGLLQPSAGETVEMPRFEVSARQEALYNAIDRKVYNVGQDVHSATGTASDLLQNVPAVQVDVDGTVSLRGDANVQILVNGKSSALMDGDPATALEQMGADRIERIEVITNPSARYRPDGTGGIINLVLKRGHDEGVFSTARVNVGNDDRYNASFTANNNPGGFNLFGTTSLRKDGRTESDREAREHFDEAGALVRSSLQQSEQRTRRRSLQGEIGIEDELGANTEWTASLGYRSGESTADSRAANVLRGADDVPTLDYDRLETGRETEDEFEFELQFDHTFSRDRELSVEFSHEAGSEREREEFSDVFRTPAAMPAFEENRTHSRERETELSADYVHPLDDGTRIEAGYSLERERSDEDFLARSFDSGSGTWIVDQNRTNRFVHDTTTHALYATYGRPVGRFGVLAGGRFQQTSSTAHQVTAATRARHDYTRVYPSLHVTCDLIEGHRLQASYSHRINQPDADELNPYPRFDDPFEIERGNPNLEPEDIHSVEIGYEYRRDDTTLLASIYHRRRAHGITEVTRIIEEGVLLTTPENLATSRASGLELGATLRPSGGLALNFGANVYRDEIDAGNLGFVQRRAATAWDAKLNVSWEPTPSWLVQLTSNYRAKRLTPQGERRPTHSTNVGVRYDLPGDRTSVVLTVSDLFNTQRFRTVIATPELRSDVTRRRSSRMVYLGFVYRFGRPGDRDRDDGALEFDDEPLTSEER